MVTASVRRTSFQHAVQRTNSSLIMAQPEHLVHEGNDDVVRGDQRDVVLEDPVLLGPGSGSGPEIQQHREGEVPSRQQLLREPGSRSLTEE